MKSYQERLNFAESRDNKNDGHTEESPDYIDQEINVELLSVITYLDYLLGLSPVKAVVGKQDRPWYGKQKVKEIKKSLLGLAASAYDNDTHQNVPNVLT